MKCFYHSSDFDGQCSGAIVKLRFLDCEMLPINYGDKVPWDDITVGETVFMVDFSLPAEDMVALNQRTNFIWIDHHKSAIDTVTPSIIGLREIGLGACALVWRYLFRNKDLPYAVQLLAQYDVWNHTNPDTLPFQYGLRLRDTTPGNELWRHLLIGNYEIMVSDVIKTGKVVLEYEKSENAYYAKASAFEVDWDGHKCIVISKLFGGSDLFESVFDPERHDMMVSFGWLNGSWKVGLRSENGGAGDLAVKYGGGGHGNAAGFNCNELPFKLK